MTQPDKKPTDSNTLTLSLPEPKALLRTFLLLFFVGCLATHGSKASSRDGYPQLSDTPTRTTYTATEYDQLYNLAEKHDTVHAIVNLNVNHSPEGKINQLSVNQQRSAIESTQSQLLAELEGTGFEIKRRYKTAPGLALKLSAPAAKVLQNTDLVESVTLDRFKKTTLTQSAPHIEAKNYHDNGKQGSNGMIVVLDTGMDTNHPAFASRLKQQACFSEGGDCPDGSTEQIGEPAGKELVITGPEVQDHGSHVGGIAAGQATDVPATPLSNGVAPKANLGSIMVFHETTDFWGNPVATASTSDIQAALDHVADTVSEKHNVISVNLSLGGANYKDYCGDVEPTTKDLFANLRSKNIAPIVASGNEGEKDAIAIPACIKEAIAVGATKIDDSNGNKVDEVITSFSNQEPKMVDIVAPGTGIRSAVPYNSSDTKPGTSMAAPHVAGAWALVRQVIGTKDVGKIEDFLIRNGKTIEDNRDGAPEGATYTSIRTEPVFGDPFADSSGCLIEEFPYLSSYTADFRTLRDNLVTTSIGRLVVEQYYSLSNYFANQVTASTNAPSRTSRTEPSH